MQTLGDASDNPDQRIADDVKQFIDAGAGNVGILPTGLLQLVIVTSGVIFAYAAVELVGTAAGETEDPPKVMPRAINSVILRIAVFYVGSLILLALLLPYTSYQQGTSPFVTFFSKIGVEGAGTVMNVVVLTAAFSSLNAGLYSTGRILRSMAMNGSAPKFTAVMSSRGVPSHVKLLRYSATGLKRFSRHSAVAASRT